MTSIVAIVGPTGSGKTELSLALAAELSAEIVNCDSRQIYRGLDIGSAKPTVEQRARVPHHVFDVAEPNDVFDCARYRELARAAIDEIAGRGRAVILVGGTGLYLKALRYGLFAGPARDPALRAALYAEEEAERGCLYRRLGEIDARSAARIHANDLVRVVRAIEVERLTGVPLSTWHAEHEFRGDELAVRVVGLELPRPRLYERLAARCVAMVEGGLMAEVRGLVEAGYDLDLASLQSIGYREIGHHLRGQVSLDQAIQQMTRASRRFAKRQMTWFRADPTVHWVDAEVADAGTLMSLLAAVERAER